jgi:polyisoprenyl-phosphate glycosyltransferase
MRLESANVRETVMDSSKPNKLISIVLPAYNEQEVLPMTHRRFTGVGPELARLGFDYELIFVNDGSRDATASMLDKMAHSDEHVRAVHLTRNFGHQAAVTAGLAVARGDVVAVMDCDLQDPPETLPTFLTKWAEGYQVVYAVRRKRKEWFGKRLAYWTFYRLMGAIAELDIPLDSGDFCVMDRSAVDLLNSLPEKQRFVRGLRTWVGLKQVGVEYERDARAAGVPQYTFRKLLKLAADGLVSFSGVPLRFVTRMGVAIMLLSIAALLWVAIDSIWNFTDAPRGWASTICVILFVSSIQMISLGVIGEYLARIFLEVKGRPTYMIASIVDKSGRRQTPQVKSSKPDSVSTYDSLTADRLMLNSVVIAIIFITSLWVTFRRGPGAAFVYVMLPVMMFLSQLPPFQLQPLPNFTPTSTVAYAAILAMICTGKFPRIKLHALDVMVILLMLSRMCTAYSQGNFWTIVSVFGDQLLNWIAPYYLARLAFFDPELRRRGAYILAGCAIGVSIIGIMEFRLFPLFYARLLSQFGLSDAWATMVMVRSGFMRAQATTAHPIDLGNVGLISAAMLLTFAASSRARLNSLWIMAGFCGAVAMVVWSISFSCVAGLSAGTAMFIVARYAPAGGYFIPALVTLTIIGLLYMITALLNFDLGVRPGEDASAVAGSYWVRALIAQRSWPFVQQSGFFGYGAENLTRAELRLESVDNSYFLFIMRFGWMFITLWFIMVYIIAFTAMKMLSNNPPKNLRLPIAAACAGLFGVMISMFTVWFGFAYAQLWIMLLGLFASMSQVVARMPRTFAMPVQTPQPIYRPQPRPARTM